MSHEDISAFTEPILSIEGIEPVLAHYSSLFDNVRKNATKQIGVQVCSAVDNLFDVYVDYMKTITTKAYSVANYEHVIGNEKYVPLSLVESGARVMQTKLRQLMSTEIDATTLKLSELLKLPLHFPLNNQNSHDSDDDQQETAAQAIMDQLEKNLEDMSDVEDVDDDDEDQNRRKRNKQKRKTELSCEKIAQMAVLIRKLERYQLMEQKMLLRRLEKQKMEKKQIDLQLKQELIQQQLEPSTFESDLVNNNQQSQQSPNESHDTNDLKQPTQSEPTNEQQFSPSPPTSNGTSSVFNHSQIPNPILPAPRPLCLIQHAPGFYQLVQPHASITSQQHSTNQSETDRLSQVPIYFVRSATPLSSETGATPTLPGTILSNTSITNQISNGSNLASPSEELSNSATLSDQNVNNESDDEVTFLENVYSVANRNNQNDGDVSAEQDAQPVLEQAESKVHRSALVSKRTLMDQHLLSVHRILPYNCLINCGAKFATLEGINAHLTEAHPQIKLFSCTCLCNPNQFKCYSDLFLHHENRHPQVGVCGCTEVNCLFKVGWSDVLHSAQRSLCPKTIADKDYCRVVCPIRGCGQTLASLSNARGHLVAHREDRPFVCSRCKEAFKRKKNCVQHIRGKHSEGRELTTEQVDNHIQVCSPVDEQPAQLMDNLFIQLTSEGTATIVSIKPNVQTHGGNAASIMASTQNHFYEQEPNSIQSFEDMANSVEANVSIVATSPTVASTSFPSASLPSTSTTNSSFNNSYKRILVTSDETRTSRPSKSPKCSAPFKANQFQCNTITSQAQTSGQLKPPNLKCPHCSARLETRATLNSHILSAHKCSQLQTRLFNCAFVGCSASRPNKPSVQSHIATVHHQTVGDPCEYFDIVDK